MKNPVKLILLCTIFTCLTIHSYAQDKWTAKQQQVIEDISKLSATTAPNGQGADAYGRYLADGFSRWTIGSAVTNSKQDWVEGVREWFDDGWRVADRNQEILEIQILDNVAHVRRIVTETYLGPKGDSSSSKAALAEIWVYKNGQWLLYRVNVDTMNND